MRVKPAIAICVTIVCAFAVISATQMLGIWNSDRENAPKVGLDGTYGIEDIKGSLTFSEVEEYYGVPVSALAEAFGIDAGQADGFKCKDVSTLYPDAAHTVNNNTVKAFVAFYLGRTIDLEDGSIYLPVSTAAVVLRDGSPTEKQKAYLESHTFDPTLSGGGSPVAAQGQGSGDGAGAGDGGSGSGSKSNTGQSATDIELTGGNTFVEVSSIYGILAEDLSAAFGLSAEQYAFYQLKDLKTLYSGSSQTIGPGSVKLFVAFYAGYSYDISAAETYLPQSAVDVLKAHGGLSADQTAYLDAHTC